MNKQKQQQPEPSKAKKDGKKRFTWVIRADRRGQVRPVGNCK